MTSDTHRFTAIVTFTIEATFEDDKCDSLIEQARGLAINHYGIPSCVIDEVEISGLQKLQMKNSNVQET